MKKASEYREHAVECRTLAAQMQGDQRKQLLEMARTWDKLAEDRSDLIRRHPELAHAEEVWARAERILDVRRARERVAPHPFGPARDPGVFRRRDRLSGPSIDKVLYHSGTVTLSMHK